MDGRKNPYGIAIDSKGNVWFNEFATNAIGKIDPNTMKLTEYPLPDERDARSPHRDHVRRQDLVHGLRSRLRRPP